MKKKIVLFVLFIVLVAKVFADTMFLFPAMGMQTIHNIIPLNFRTESGADYSEGDSLYKYYINKNPGSTDAGTSTEFDRIAIALTGFRDDDGDGMFVVNSNNPITVTVEYDGFFTSDENSVYVRPYSLYPLERTRNNNGSTHSILGSVLEPGSDSFTYPSQNILSYSAGSGTNKRVWIDFILQLPGDKAPDGSGINVGNTYYPLIEGTYSTEVTIKVEGPLGNDIITIPVVAQYEPDDNRTILNRSSEVSLNVSPTANAVNLNLSDMLMTGESVKIGTFSFMLRTATNSTYSATNDMDLSPNYSIFLSASPDPFSQENNGFMFVHEDYVVGESFYNEQNSVNFYVDVQGTGSTLGRNATFDGRDYADTDGKVKDTELLTKCNKETALAGGNNYIHYHTFEGDIALYVPRNTNSQLNAGRYQGDIYVHVISFAGE